MRSGPVYERVGTLEEPAEGTHYATVTSHGDDRVKLHSKVAKHVEVPLPESFPDTLRFYTNQNMWNFMNLDDQGEWITEAILNGTLDVAHDGSYQPEITKAMCSTAVWVC